MVSAFLSLDIRLCFAFYMRSSHESLVAWESGVWWFPYTCLLCKLGSRLSWFALPWICNPASWLSLKPSGHRFKSHLRQFSVFFTSHLKHMPLLCFVFKFIMWVLSCIVYIQESECHWCTGLVSFCSMNSGADTVQPNMYLCPRLTDALWFTDLSCKQT